MYFKVQIESNSQDTLNVVSLLSPCLLVDFHICKLTQSPPHPILAGHPVPERAVTEVIHCNEGGNRGQAKKRGSWRTGQAGGTGQVEGMGAEGRIGQKRRRLDDGEQTGNGWEELGGWGRALGTEQLGRRACFCILRLYKIYDNCATKVARAEPSQTPG